jgi:hypothetical protein
MSNGGEVKDVPDELTLRIYLMDVAEKSRIATHQAENQLYAMTNTDEFKYVDELAGWHQWLTGRHKPLAQLIDDYVGIDKPLAAFNYVHNMLTINVLRRRDEMEALHANIYPVYQNPLFNPSASYLPELQVLTSYLVRFLPTYLPT